MAGLPGRIRRRAVAYGGWIENGIRAAALCGEHVRARWLFALKATQGADFVTHWMDAGRSDFAAAYVQTAGGRFDLMPLKVTELASAQTIPESDEDHGRVSMTVEQSFAAVAVSLYDDGFAHGSFVRFFNSANARPARRPSLVAVESSSSAWSERPASNAVNQRRNRAS